MNGFCQIDIHMGSFNVRVYGILLHATDQVLVADENIYGKIYRKFPGGGLEFGEGTIRCLKREFLEELNLEIEVMAHFYTTDFFQQSAFRKDDQIISIYYLVKAVNDDLLHKLSHANKEDDLLEESKATAGESLAAKTENFQLIDVNKMKVDDFSLPIDKVVAGMMLAKKHLLKNS